MSKEEAKIVSSVPYQIIWEEGDFALKSLSVPHKPGSTEDLLDWRPRCEVQLKDQCDWYHNGFRVIGDKFSTVVKPRNHQSYASEYNMKIALGDEEIDLMTLYQRKKGGVALSYNGPTPIFSELYDVANHLKHNTNGDVLMCKDALMVSCFVEGGEHDNMTGLERLLKKLESPKSDFAGYFKEVAPWWSRVHSDTASNKDLSEKALLMKEPVPVHYSSSKHRKNQYGFWGDEDKELDNCRMFFERIEEGPEANFCVRVRSAPSDEWVPYIERLSPKPRKPHQKPALSVTHLKSIFWRVLIIYQVLVGKGAFCTWNIKPTSTPVTENILGLLNSLISASRRLKIHRKLSQQAYRGYISYDDDENLCGDYKGPALDAWLYSLLVDALKERSIAWIEKKWNDDKEEVEEFITNLKFLRSLYPLTWRRWYKSRNN